MRGSFTPPHPLESAAKSKISRRGAPNAGPPTAGRHLGPGAGGGEAPARPGAGSRVRFAHAASGARGARGERSSPRMPPGPAAYAAGPGGGTLHSSVFRVSFCRGAPGRRAHVFFPHILCNFTKKRLVSVGFVCYCYYVKGCGHVSIKEYRMKHTHMHNTHYPTGGQIDIIVSDRAAKGQPRSTGGRCSAGLFREKRG